MPTGVPDWFIRYYFAGQETGMWQIQQWAALSGYAKELEGYAAVPAGSSAILAEYTVPSNKYFFIVYVQVSPLTTSTPYRFSVYDYDSGIDLCDIVTDRWAYIALVVPFVVPPGHTLRAVVVNNDTASREYVCYIYGWEVEV